jgi:hypothetical protein
MVGSGNYALSHEALRLAGLVFVFRPFRPKKRFRDVVVLKAGWVRVQDSDRQVDGLNKILI